MCTLDRDSWDSERLKFCAAGWCRGAGREEEHVEQEEEGQAAEEAGQGPGVSVQGLDIRQDCDGTYVTCGLTVGL